MALRADSVQVGDELPATTVTVSRESLVRYAGASEDFNPVHWNPRVAQQAGLPDVIAHGMLTMAIAARTVTGWAGDPATIVEYRTRFSRPILVPDDSRGASIEVRGRVGARLDAERLRVDLVVTSGGTRVLSDTHVIVRLTG